MPASCAPRRGHVAPTGWMRRWRRSCRRSRAAVTACVQIGHKGRLAFFRPATEPRNHAVSFRPFQSGKALCIQFGHRPALEDCLVTARRRIPMHNPPQPVPDTQRLFHGWWVRHQAPSCAVRPGTFRAAGRGLLRAGAFDAAGDWIPVPRCARCPRREGKVPGRAGCPRRRPGMGATRTSDSPHVPVGPGAKGATSRPPAGLGC